MNILVIKLAALGDVVQAFGPFAAIRAHHPGARITLLTTAPFAGLLGRAPWFDEIWPEGRPAWTDLPAVARLAWRMRRGRFARVYDLQTSARSSRYQLLLGAGPEWSGIARGASHPHDDPARDALHTLDRQRAQLEAAGLRQFPAPGLEWLDADVAQFALPRHFALLVPGASAERPGKRWPIGHFSELAAGLSMPCVVVGGPAESALAKQLAPALDLTGRTTLTELAAITRRAELCVGNDTGPTHLAAATGTPTLAIFGPDSEPALCAPRGANVTVLRAVPLAAVTPAQALSAAGVLLTQPPPGPS